jgi:hypothetical protein
MAGRVDVVHTRDDRVFETQYSKSATARTLRVDRAPAGAESSAGRSKLTRRSGVAHTRPTRSKPSAPRCSISVLSDAAKTTSISPVVSTPAVQYATARPPTLNVDRGDAARP